MREAGQGRILNIASVHGQVASVGKAAYVAAKRRAPRPHQGHRAPRPRALEHHVQRAVPRLGPHTPLVQRQVEARAAHDGVTDDEAREALLLEKQPAGAFVTTEQVGATAVFLCSEAANQVRGAACRTSTAAGPRR